MLKKLSELPCETLKGVGPKLSEKLQRAGIDTLEDILFCLPLRYQDKTRLTPIRDLLPGDYAVVEGTVKKVTKQFTKKRSLLCEIIDDAGDVLEMRLFYFSEQQSSSLAVGKRLRLFGQVRQWQQKRQMVHPEYRVINSENSFGLMDEYLTAIYPQIAGLQQNHLKKLMSDALGYLSTHDIAEWLPLDYLKQFKMMNLKDALFTLHRPDPSISIDYLNDPRHPARERLAFEELIAQRLALRNIPKIKADWQAKPLVAKPEYIAEFIQALPFELTAAQQRVIDEVTDDLRKPIPMRRLIQGDVGSGKTIVAITVAYHALQSGQQVAVMAPTEILAEQLYKQFQSNLPSYRVLFLSGSFSSKQRQPILSALGSGECQLIVGTHALFQKEVNYHNLGLIIIDEQHRFGVKQRLLLQEKSERNGFLAHQLVMTATPIPRSLAMTVYADLELSVIDALPPGRQTIQTLVIDNARRSEVIARIQHICQLGQQVYWVCTLIEDSEVLQCQAATHTAGVLAEQLADIRVGLIHGQMKPSEKDIVMNEFKEGELQLLVATTVIEVGVNVPNASLMVIENPERLGLAQLHQLRGRVGRGNIQSYCTLLYQSPLNEIAKKRLQKLRESSDGFEIAEADLKIRGPGDFLGTQQTGVSRFKVACLIAHRHLLPQVKAVCQLIENECPDQVGHLVKRWYQHADEYVKV